MQPVRGDWSLQRKGPADQARHREKVLEAIRENLADIISDEAIITADGDRVVKIPLRGLKEWRFRFNPRSHDHVGQGTGRERPGDILAHDRPAGHGDGRGRAGGGAGDGGDGRGAGRAPGTDYYEAEVTVEELQELIFADLGLPRLRPKPGSGAPSRRLRFDDLRRVGPLGRLDPRRTLKAHLARRAREGTAQVAQVGPLLDDDLRYRSWRVDVRRKVAAAVIAMRDVSASMGEFKKYLTRSFFFWMVRFLRSRYDDVRIVFITHHTEAREVDEEAFFTLGESGGTRVSSAYRLALEIIDQRFNPAHWNLYPIHFTDGDNWGDGDNADCVRLVRELMDRSNLFGYGEINDRPQRSPLLEALRELEGEPGFVILTMRDRKDVYPALRRYFRMTGEEV